MTSSQHAYEVRPRKDLRRVDFISDALPFGRLWCAEPNAIGYAKFFSRSHDALIRVCDATGNVIETHEHKGRFQRVVARRNKKPQPKRLQPKVGAILQYFG